MGAVCATDSVNVSDTEDSNLISDNVDTLSANDKLEVSSEDSISETNIVYSQDDNLGNSLENEASESQNFSDEDNVDQSASDDLLGDVAAKDSTGSNTDNVATVSSSNDNVNVAGSSDSGNNVISAKASSNLAVSDTHYGKSATYFKVTLKDASGKSLSNQKITFKVKGKTYSANTDKNGIASIKTPALAVGSYDVVVSYSGDSKYNSSSLSKKIKVLSSVIGSDLTKFFGDSSQFKATFWKNDVALAKTKISYKVNGKSYTVSTDKNGVAKININLAVGKYVITLTNPYSNEKVSKNIVVKKDSTSFSPVNAKTYIFPNYKIAYSVKLTTKHGAPVKNQVVTFNYNNKKVTSKTNANGKAQISISIPSKGTYSITYNFKGDKNLGSSSAKSSLIIKDPIVKVSASDLKMVYNDGSKFKVKLTDNNGKALVNKVITIKIALSAGKVQTGNAKTNSKGIAEYTVNNVVSGTHKVYYYNSEPGKADFNYGYGKVIVSKSPVKLTAGDLTMKYNDGSVYQVTVKDKSGKPLGGLKVKSSINGKTYTYKTNSKGIAKLKITQPVGYYKITSVLSDSRYSSSSVSKHVLIDGTKFIAESKYVTAGEKDTFSVKLVNGKNKPIKNAQVSITFNGKTVKVKSDSKGFAKIDLGAVSKGSYVIKYKHGSFSGSTKIKVFKKVTVKQVIASSKNVRNYIEKYGKLPSTVKIGDVTLSTAEYLYIASKAVVHLKYGYKYDIKVKKVNGPSHPKKTGYQGDLSDYAAVAYKIVQYVDSKGKMPDSMSSDVGNIGYGSIVYSVSRVVAFYGENHNKLPAYVTVKAVAKASSSVSPSGINPKNTIKDLTAYLAASMNCQVNNAKIKGLVAKLTKNCANDWQKAEAIFNYVRDTVSYSFYYDTRYGAVGTLNAGTGNCVDHSHLLVAMFRAAKLPARYAHGTCTFSSGSTYGHVWSQVLIGNVWTVADATSSRNSLGKVANWNTNSYSLSSYSSSISF